MPDQYRVIVTGDRNWRIDELAIRVVRKLKADHKGLIIVHGACSGVDESFAAACRGESVVDVAFGPKGMDLKIIQLRNGDMVGSGGNLCLAFHRFLPNSKGTRDCVTRALKAGIPTWHADSEDKPPRRLHRDRWAELMDKRWGPSVGDEAMGLDVRSGDRLR